MNEHILRCLAMGQRALREKRENHVTFLISFYKVHMYILTEYMTSKNSHIICENKKDAILAVWSTFHGSTGSIFNVL